VKLSKLPQEAQKAATLGSCSDACGTDSERLAGVWAWLHSTGTCGASYFFRGVISSGLFIISVTRSFLTIVIPILLEQTYNSIPFRQTASFSPGKLRRHPDAGRFTKNATSLKLLVANRPCH